MKPASSRQRHAIGERLHRLVFGWRKPAAPADARAPDAHSQLLQMVDHASTAIFVKDLDGRFVFVNREFERIKGMPLAAIVGRLDSELFPAAAAALRVHDGQVVTERRAIDFEETIETAQGRRTYLSHKFPLFDDAGNACAVCGVATDITERKRSEDALRAAALAVSSAGSDDVFAELVRYLAGILRVEVTMIAVHVGDDRARMRTLAVWLDGKLLRNFDYALAGSPCRHVVGRQFRFVGSGVRAEFPPGTLFASKGMDSYAALPLNDSAGRPLGLIAAMDRAPMRDPALAEAMLKIFAVRAVAEIERASAETALRTSEASHRAIFESSEDAIVVHDWDTGAFVDANPKACATYGYTWCEFQRLTVADISSGVPPYTVENAAAWIAKAKAGEPVTFEWHRRNRDGSLHWDEVYLKAAEIAGTRRILAFTREITQRKEAEEALRVREQQYRAIFNASADALVLWNSRSERVDVNPAYERMYGYARDEVLGGGRTREVPEEQRRQQEDIIARTLAGEHCQAEIETFRRNGERFPIEVRTIPFEHRGEPHVLAMVRDLTERRQVERERAALEAQLRQAQKMEAIGHLTGGVAHDFNNLLTSIVGYVTLAAERAEGRDATLATYLDHATASCDRARALIQQMLTFSRGRRGEPRPLGLPPLVRESVKLLRASFPSTVVLDTALDDAVPMVMLDPVQLEQVLMNLAINARDAMHGHGTIQVSVRRTDAGGVCASCRQAAAGEMVELAVRDSGPGVPPEVMERMFEPFFSTKEVGQGSGMGLSTVHGIVHEHGGHIAVDNVPGGGALFRVLLPALRSTGGRAAGAPARPGAALPRAALAGRVAVVDDEAAVAGFVRELLSRWGLAVDMFPDARGALAAIASGTSFDLVLTDQTMPGLTGLELARALGAIERAPPVVLYTGFSEGLSAAEVERAGVAALLRKPIEPAALLAVLEAHLRRAA
jgi:PAS domain S-box-containing protein